MEFNVVRDLCAELSELEIKLDHLNSFMRTDKFMSLSKIHQELLIDQCNIMFDYARVLGRRIEDLT